MQIKAKSKRIEDLKAYLEVEKKHLRQEIARSAVTTDDERTGYSNHMADDASVVFEQERNVGIQRGRELVLADVEDALRRIAEGTYGTCRHCGQAIDTARLRAMPTAVLCVNCQEMLEVH